MLALAWEGGASPLQLSGWLVTHVENGRGAEGARTRVFTVIRTAPTRFPSRCRGGCGGTGFTLNGRESKKDAIQIVDAPAAGRSVLWRIRRSRVRCRGCGRDDVEELPLYVDLHSRMTARAYLHLRRQAASKPYLSVAQEMGVGRSVIRSMMRPRFELMRQLREHQRERPSVKPTNERNLPVQKLVDGRPWVGESRVPRFLGLDEVALVDRRFPEEAHLKKYRGVMFDLETGGLVDLFMDNRKRTIAAWFAGLEAWERSRIRGVAIDMSHDYRATIRAALGEDVPIVVDRFHLDKMAQDAADTVRRAEVKARSKGRKRHGDPDVRMYARLLRRRALPVTKEPREDLRSYLQAHPLTYHAFLARQDFTEIFEDSRGSEQAEKRLRAWRQDLHPVIRPAFAAVERALDDFGREILAYFDVGITNSMTEAGNGFIKRMSRAGPGMHIETIRDKMLMRARLQPATKLICEECMRASPRYVERAGPGVGPAGSAGRIVCMPCQEGLVPKTVRRGKPVESLRRLFVPGQYADASRGLSRREAVRRRGEQLAFRLTSLVDVPVIRPTDRLPIKEPVRRRPDVGATWAEVDADGEENLDAEPEIPMDRVA